MTEFNSLMIVGELMVIAVLIAGIILKVLDIFEFIDLDI
jgi:hypothetical protein